MVSDIQYTIFFCFFIFLDQFSFASWIITLARKIPTAFTIIHGAIDVIGNYSAIVRRELFVTRQEPMQKHACWFHARAHRILICIWMVHLLRHFWPIEINTTCTGPSYPCNVQTDFLCTYPRYLSSLLCLLLIIGIGFLVYGNVFYWFYRYRSNDYVYRNGMMLRNDV